jgi:hypothetical protein
MLSRIRPVFAACGRVVLGPFRDRSRLDRVGTGAAGGILVLAAIAMPVTVVSVAKSHTVPSWVLTLCIVIGIFGLVLIIKSCQRPLGDIAATQPANAHVVPASSSDITVKKSSLMKSGVSIPEGSSALVDDSILDESPLTIRDRPQIKPNSDKQ